MFKLETFLMNVMLEQLARLFYSVEIAAWLASYSWLGSMVHGMRSMTILEVLFLQ